MIGGATFQKRAKGCFFRVGALALTGAVCVLLLEDLVRWTIPQQLVILREDIYVPDDVYGWNRAAGLDTTINTGERTVRLITDRSGHRIAEPGVVGSAEVRVLALGDSFTEALQVDHRDSFVGLMEAALGPELGTTVSVVNSGVAGWGPSHYLLKAREQLSNVEAPYDLMIVFFFLGNDAETARRDSFPRKEPEIRHTFHWPRDLSGAAIVDALLYPVNDLLEERSHLFVAMRNAFPGVKSSLVRVRHAARRGGSVEGLLASDPRHRSQNESDRWSISAGICADIAALGAENGVETLFVVFDGLATFDDEAFKRWAGAQGVELSSFDRDQPRRQMLAELRSHGLNVIDMRPALASAWAEEPREMFGRADTHFGPRGHRVMAETVTPRPADLIRESRRIEDLSRTESR